MIEIVKFEQQGNEVEIGFRQGVAVVYATVPTGLSDGEVKQLAYEQVKLALEYEQTRDKPSFTIPDEDEEGIKIEFEKFIPAEPQVKSITIHGDTLISFEDDRPSKTIEFVATAIDQYGDSIDSSFDWTGADSGVITVDNTDGSYEVTVVAGNVSESMMVTVLAYVAPLPAQPEVDYEKLALFEAVAGLEDRMAKAEGGRE